MIKKIKTLIKLWKRIDGIDQKLDRLQYTLGNIEYRQIKNDPNALIEFKAFSQWGEDGIIQWLINNVEISEKRFIEFGIQNYVESNTRYLLMHDNWSGLVIDGGKENIDYVKNDDIYWRYNLTAVHSFITAENINEIFVQNGFTGNIGILSVDIDGNDYWVWKAINNINPDIVICEYNHRFGMDKAVTVPYDPAFVRHDKHYSNIYYGASIKALTYLAKEKGYTLVAGNSNGNNVFFVRNDLVNDVVKERQIEDVFCHGNFRECCNQDGELAFFSNEEERHLLEQLPLVDVSIK